MQRFDKNNETCRTSARKMPTGGNKEKGGLSPAFLVLHATYAAIDFPGVLITAPG